MHKQRATRGATRQGISEHSGPSMFRTWLSRSSPVISKSKRFPVVLPLLDLNSAISKPHSKFFSTDSPMGPFVGSDDHIVRVVNRNGNACRQARVHWLLASLVVISVQLILKGSMRCDDTWLSTVGIFTRNPARAPRIRATAPANRSLRACPDSGGGTDFHVIWLFNSTNLNRSRRQ